MRRGRSSSEPQKEDMLTVMAVMAMAFGGVIFLIWLSSSVKIVTYWTPKLYALSKVWLWLPGDVGAAPAAAARAAAIRFWENPKKVGFGEWIGFINYCAWPLAIIVGIALIAWLARICFHKPPQVRRNFDPQDLAAGLSHVFTGTAPVLHLRKAIAADKEPFWRRQVFPHEVLLNELVNGKPLVMDGQMVGERAADYFRGIHMVKGTDGGVGPRRIGGRLVSRMVGHQVVDLLTDRGKNVVFPDRFSSAGKVIYALLCAHAFGGPEGVEDYRKARDQLNNSARGAKHGFANLTVAQWLFDKYRAHPTARQLFAIHHWEYTYLFELMFQAKRQGKCGDSEFIWLKPMSRFLFYAMNTVGRLTPHTESAAVFAQHAYERKVARRKRLPLMRTPDGGYVHVIYVDKAVKGLALEWERWRDGDPDDDQWWRSEAEWKRLNGAILTPPPAPPPALAGETAFDSQMSADARRQSAAQDAQLNAAIASEAGRLNQDPAPA